MIKQLYQAEDHVAFLVRETSHFLIRKDGLVNYPSLAGLEHPIRTTGDSHYFSLPPRQLISELKHCRLKRALKALFQLIKSLDTMALQHGALTIENLRVLNGQLQVINYHQDQKSDVVQLGHVLTHLFVGTETSTRPCHVSKTLWKLIRRCKQDHTVADIEPLFQKTMKKPLKVVQVQVAPDEAIAMVDHFKRASKGNVDSMTKVAKAYTTNTCASYWLRMAAWHGCPKATLALAKMRNENALVLMEKHIELPEIAEAYVDMQINDLKPRFKEFLVKGVQQERPRSEYLMGRLLLADDKDPLPYFEKASAHGDLDATYYLAKLIMTEDVERAKALLVENCSKDHQDSFIALGQLLEESQPCTAFFFFKRGTTPLANLHVARCMYYGIGTDKNEQVAISKMMEIDHLEKYYLLYQIHLGDNKREAKKWAKMGASQGCWRCILVQKRRWYKWWQ